MNIENTKNKIPEIIRWIAVIPGAFLSAFLINFPLHWVLYGTLVNGSWIEMPFKNIIPIEEFLSPIIMPMTFVYAGAKIAPKKQFLVSIILFLLIILSRIIIHYYMLSLNRKFDMSIYNFSQQILVLLSLITGILLVYKSNPK